MLALAMHVREGLPILFAVADEKGQPVFGLRPSDFSLTEEGLAVPGVELSTAVNVQEPLSAVLTIDVSGSNWGTAIGHFTVKIGTSRITGNVYQDFNANGIQDLPGDTGLGRSTAARTFFR